MDKCDIRKNIKVLREAQSNVLRLIKSAKITERLLSLDIFQPTAVQGRKISIFCNHLGEPETFDIYAKLTEYGAKCYFPVIKDNRIIMAEGQCESNRFENFVQGELGIREPAEYKNEFIKMDIIIIPGVAFSKDGDRIGFGKGFYDKLLSYYEPCDLPPLVAPIFEFQLVDDIVPSEFDIPVDIIVTEARIIKTGARMKIC